MLEGGADVRIIQEILGHAETSTTAIYTRVSIKRLKIVHEQTHPTARLTPKKSVATVATVTTEEELLATLEDEAVEDDEP